MSLLCCVMKYPAGTYINVRDLDRRPCMRLAVTLRRMATLEIKGLDTVFTLNDGYKMPAFGLGVYKMTDGTECSNCVKYALQNGYRLIDTAEMYGNEADVGQGLQASGLKREEYFVVTKTFTFGKQATANVVKQSLKKLACKYIDLYLLHTPKSSRAKILDSYRALMEMQKQGLVRSIGVSNFGIKHLEIMREEGLPTPAVNQIELNPFQRHADIVEYCRQHKITVMGYSPLMKGRRLDDSELVTIANKYGKSVPELCIRWSIQHGFITIPKTVRHQRMLDNTQCFNWTIGEEDLKAIDASPTMTCTTFPSDPTLHEWK